MNTFDADIQTTRPEKEKFCIGSERCPVGSTTTTTTTTTTASPGKSVDGSVGPTTSGSGGGDGSAFGRGRGGVVVRGMKPKSCLTIVRGGRGRGRGIITNSPDDEKKKIAKGFGPDGSVSSVASVASVGVGVVGGVGVGVVPGDQGGLEEKRFQLVKTKTVTGFYFFRKYVFVVFKINNSNRIIEEEFSESNNHSNNNNHNNHNTN